MKGQREGRKRRGVGESLVGGRVRNRLTGRMSVIVSWWREGKQNEWEVVKRAVEFEGWETRYEGKNQKKKQREGEGLLRGRVRERTTGRVRVRVWR